MTEDFYINDSLADWATSVMEDPGMYSQHSRSLAQSYADLYVLQSEAEIMWLRLRVAEAA